MSDRPFWKEKSLAQLTPQEWESLCDGCGKCCVLKLEDVDTSQIYYTDVACRMLDCTTGKCLDYKNRKQHVPDCILLTPETIEQLAWMPQTCAYRLVHEGKDLPLWHPLVSGKAETIHLAGMSVAGHVFPEDSVEEEDMADHIKDWDRPTTS